jgi:hypothetical protein
VDRHMIAYGCATTASPNVIDPLLIRWSSREDFTDWTPSDTNTSGDVRLQSGDRIVGAVPTRGQILVFTNQSVYGMQWIGGDSVFRLDELGQAGGLAGPHSAADHQGVVYWMSQGNFYKYDGAISVLFCPVLNHVFEDINVQQEDQIWAAVNKEFSEVWWFYCSALSNVPDKYVIYNFVEGSWAFGDLDRSIYLDRGTAISPAFPIAADNAGQLYFQEKGVNDETGAGITSFAETGEFEIEEGNVHMFMDDIIPDFRKLTSGSVDISLKFRNYPANSAGETTVGPLAFTPTTTHKNLRGRGKQMALRIDSSVADVDWRLGSVRVRIRPDGRRG